MESITFTTLGELIKVKREEQNLSISELGRLTEISKGVISKIESGETKRPQLRTLKPIAEVLQIPFVKFVEPYMEMCQNVDVLFDLVSEAIDMNNEFIVSKLAKKILESPLEDTYIALERLFNLTSSIADNEMKLVFYKSIVTYARQHGIPIYIAKGLFQRYQIESKNMKCLEESFKTGEELLHYTDFLSNNEKINIYYQMAFQAHDMELYDRCIELGKNGHAEDTSRNEIKERIALAICNSFFRIGNFSEMETHIQMYEKLGYRFIIERAKYLRAIILSKTGSYHEAIPVLQECINEATKNNRIHRVNELLEALLKINAIDYIHQIIEREESNFAFEFNNVYNFSELGKYYKCKGAFLVAQGIFDEGINAYLQSIMYYAKINASDEILNCAIEINDHHCEMNKDMNLGLLKKMKKVYNMVKNG
ncbi:helix-turn-helix domain-containing protein [Brevibacillus daliensis]|uniref:helix-turn-helix domain-containing protein n=1 Tax=Brevibacillus daliensis TaxID=2892995 RepID=UPI00281590F5|nr:helix-turn-helix transcriptional regulator [Brevibacillus daliensis]